MVLYWECYRLPIFRRMRESSPIYNWRMVGMDPLNVEIKLDFRQDTSGFKLPVLLPHLDPLVDMIIRDEHLKNMHGSLKFLMSNFREKFWIIKGRRSCWRIVNQCLQCRRFSTMAAAVKVSPFPEDQIKDADVFEVVKVDLVGPLLDKDKAWIVIFTCAVFRWFRFYLELVDAVSTEAFLDFFSRFVSVRGKRTSVIHSDHGTNLIGANNPWKVINWDKVQNVYAMDKIRWKFNPSAAPLWGGFLERLIRSVKDLLKRTLGSSRMSY